MNVAIIGHGPSMKNKGYGGLIDSHDLVIRMAECDWQYQYDYGSRYDVGVFTDGPTKEWAKRSNKIPVKEFWYYKIEQGDEIIPVTFKGHPTLQVGVHHWINYLHKGFNFSRGTASAILVNEMLTPDRITLFGFDAVMHGFQGRNKHHPKVFRRFSNTHRYIKGGNTHDWLSEKRLIMKVLSDNVKIEVKE